MTPQHLFHSVFGIEATIASIVFVLVLGVLLTAVIVYRRRPGREPSKKTSHTRIEAVYVLGVAAVAMYLIVTSLTSNGERLNKKPDLTVSVTGFQWCWRFAYPGPVTVTGSCVNGHTPTAVLPAGKVIRFRVTSVDVVHGFWIPYLKFKTYAYPHHVNTFEAVFPRPGSYPGRCAVFCGLYHTYMDFTVRVVKPAQFSAWLAGSRHSALSPSAAP